MKKAAPKKKVASTPPSYSATIKVLGRTYSAVGETLPDTLASLSPNGVVKGMSILAVTKGAITREKVLPAMRTTRLFSPSKFVREVAIKQTAALFTL